MEQTEIRAGHHYYDGKDGLREVLSIDADSLRYRILAARQERAYSYKQGTMVSVIGTEITCTVATFATWAKRLLTPLEAQQLLLEMQARKTKLSPGELAFMKSAYEEAGGTITPGTAIQVDHTEGRAVAGLAKKGLMIRNKGEAEVTALGAAWFRSFEGAVRA